MDIYCQKCGSEWDVFDITDWPEKQKDFYDGQGCPDCDWGKTAPLVPPKRAEFAKALRELLGDDIDGIAAELEDAEFLGLLDD